MVLSIKLLEREGRSTVLDYTITLLCAKHKAASYSLTLVESSDLGDLRHAVGKRIRSPKNFVDAVLSLRDWTELDIDYDVIIGEVCAPLRTLDADFAASVADHIATERSGIAARQNAVRA